MNPNDDSTLLDHTVDGISELDNRLPRWWLWLFYITIGFSVAYVGYYHVIGVGLSSTERYNKAMGITDEAMAAAEEAEPAVPMDPTTDETILARGETIFMTQCATCHGKQGQGLIGPNMCDYYFKHGPEFADTVRIIQNGTKSKLIPFGLGITQYIHRVVKTRRRRQGHGARPARWRVRIGPGAIR